jgi:hypothetical protein
VGLLVVAESAVPLVGVVGPVTVVARMVDVVPQTRFVVGPIVVPPPPTAAAVGAVTMAPGRGSSGG